MVMVFVGITFVIYFMVFTLPGDPVRSLTGGVQLSPNVIAQMRSQYHLDDPFLVQYAKYVGGILRGDFGTDFHGRPVTQLMGERWPVTIRLALTAWVVEAIVGIGLGVVAALRKHRWLDHTILLFTIGVISIPIFVLGYTLQLVLGVNTQIFPIAGVESGWPRSYILPSIVLATFSIASITRLVRASVLDNLRADYIRTARAKGLSPQRVVVRHALRNSLIPAVTYLGIDLGFLVSGTLIVEGIFNMPGVGQLLFSSIQQKQGPVVVGIATLFILIFLLANLVVDLLYGILDPRIARD